MRSQMEAVQVGGHCEGMRQRAFGEVSFSVFSSFNAFPTFVP